MKRLVVIAASWAAAGCGTNMTPEPAPVPTLPTCVPNRDGQITADELPIAIGATITYYAATNRTIDPTLHNGAWKLADEAQGDMKVALGPVALGEQWYAPSFPNGAFVVDAGSGLDGIYHQDDRALWLDGTASHADTPKTLIVYQPPIAVLRFPVHDADSYSTTAMIDATISGLPFIGTDKVDVDITGSGRLDVPYVEFSPVLRAHVHVTRTPSTGTPVVQKRTMMFLFECFGEVARAESKQDEVDPDFTTAAYFRQFALGVTP